MGVVLVHVSQYLPPQPWPFVTWVDAGARGVELFFIASAMTLAGSWEARNDGVVRFYIRRFFRIAPLFWLAIAFYASVYGAWGNWPAILTSAFFVNGLHPGWLWSSPVPGAWTIATEMAFYAIFPFLAALVTSLRRAVVLFVIAIVIDQLLSPQVALSWAPLLGVTSEDAILNTAWLWLPAQMPVFAVGFVIYYTLKLQRPSAAVANSIGLAGIAVALLFSLFFMRMAEWSVALGLIVYSMGLGGLAPLNNRLTRSVGVVSFGIYLVHFIVIEQIIAPLIQGASQGWIFMVYPGALAVAWLCAALLYRAVEVPGRALGRGIISRMGAPRSLQKLGAS